MNYQETINYLFSALPMFHRVGAAAYKPNLDNTLALANALGNPQQYLKCIHVAGTNGKGSTSHMLASILQEAGYKVGLYTSPHLKDFRERIKINGEMVSEDWLVNYVQKNKKLYDEIQPSFFEMSTIMAFSYFDEMKTDLNVIETGLGGRLDSTNIISPELSIITNIGWDHMNLLGDTLEKIAVEKGGIMKENISVVISETQNETKSIFTNIAKEKKSEIYFADANFNIEINNFNLLEDRMQFSVSKNNIEYLNSVSCDLTGQYQLKNLLGVFQSIDLIREKYALTDAHIRNGLSSVKENTGLKGRWQILSRNPLTICDTGHNEQGLIEVLSMIEKIPYKKLHFILGVVDDKDLSKMLKMLPKSAQYYFCKADIPRGLSPQILQANAQLFDLHGDTYDSVTLALESAKSNAKSKDLIFVGGSTFTVAEII
ncbi:MAG: bifunctional folylpolyglutamate synthase/dihydrofolate synthase [Bacteroidia bacterium]|nr:bifunctional folylpolyglutamate synthase/dihydrofolate synthase [Bacteroidota bacterium]MBP6513229.1 bifunctional folylpolyglutamate synthase/dihydrofolate synthase [Bacteroidia bacterium]